MVVKHMGVRELRTGLTEALRGGDVIAVERHGELLGYYFPVKRRPSENERRAYLAKANAMLTSLREHSGLTEDEFAAEWDDAAPSEAANDEALLDRADPARPSF